MGRQYLGFGVVYQSIVRAASFCIIVSFIPVNGLTVCHGGWDQELTHQPYSLGTHKDVVVT